MQIIKDFVNGLWNENPIFRMVIGICSALQPLPQITVLQWFGTDVCIDMFEHISFTT